MTSITLYENDENLHVTYDTNNAASLIVPYGRSFEFTECYFPKYTKKFSNKNGIRTYDRELIFELREKSEHANWKALLNSYFGWAALIIIDSNNQFFIKDPLFVQNTNENYQKGINYELKLRHYVDSIINDITYMYRDFLTVDQTDITVDSDLITADQIWL